MPWPTADIIKAGPALTQQFIKTLAFLFSIEPIIYNSFMSFAPVGYPLRSERKNMLISSAVRQNNFPINFKTLLFDKRLVFIIKIKQTVKGKSEGIIIFEQIRRLFKTAIFEVSKSVAIKNPKITANRKKKYFENFFIFITLKIFMQRLLLKFLFHKLK